MPGRHAKDSIAAAAALISVLVPAAAQAQGREALEACDFTDPAVCLYPWPNDHYTKRDASTPTGRRLALQRSSMPKNKDGKPLDPTDMNRADGFSPGSMLITKVPGLDTLAAGRKSGLPRLGDVSKSLAKRSPVVVINARTGKRHPVWAEVDSNPDGGQGPRAHHSPGQELRGGRALHRRAPEPEERERRDDRGG